MRLSKFLHPQYSVLLMHWTEAVLVALLFCHQRNRRYIRMVSVKSITYHFLAVSLNTRFPLCEAIRFGLI